MHSSFLASLETHKTAHCRFKVHTSTNQLKSTQAFQLIQLLTSHPFRLFAQLPVAFLPPSPLEEDTCVTNWFPLIASLTPLTYKQEERSILRQRRVSQSLDAGNVKVSCHFDVSNNAVKMTNMTNMFESRSCSYTRKVHLDKLQQSQLWPTKSIVEVTNVFFASWLP